MNMKAIALLLAMTMVFAGTAVYLADGSSADDGETSNVDRIVYVRNNGSATITFKITEPSESYYYNEVTWSDNSGTIFSYSTGQSNGTSNVAETNVSRTVDISFERSTSDSNTVTYTATISGTGTTTTPDYKLHYKIVTYVKSTDGHEGDEGVDQELDYTLNIQVIETPLTSTLFGTSTILQFGKPIKEFTIEGYDADYVYYAIGLPSGVQMTPDGKISGTPIADDVSISDTYDITIVATHVDSNQTFTKTYSVTVNAADSNDFDYVVNPDNSGAVKVVVSKEKYMIVQDNSFTIKTTNTSGVAQDISGVYIIDSSGKQTNVTKTGNTIGIYEISTTGSGSFTVVMENNGAIKSFELVVVAISTNVQTGIGFSSGENGFTVIPPVDEETD